MKFPMLTITCALFLAGCAVADSAAKGQAGTIMEEVMQICVTSDANVAQASTQLATSGWKREGVSAAKRYANSNADIAVLQQIGRVAQSPEKPSAAEQKRRIDLYRTSVFELTLDQAQKLLADPPLTTNFKNHSAYSKGSDFLILSGRGNNVTCQLFLNDAAPFKAFYGAIDGTDISAAPSVYQQKQEVKKDPSKAVSVSRIKATLISPAQFFQTVGTRPVSNAYLETQKFLNK